MKILFFPEKGIAPYTQLNHITNCSLFCILPQKDFIAALCGQGVISKVCRSSEQARYIDGTEWAEGDASTAVTQGSPCWLNPLKGTGSIIFGKENITATNFGQGSGPKSCCASKSAGKIYIAAQVND